MNVTVKTGHDFIEALRNVNIFAGTDDTLPALCGVQMEWDADGTVELVATDRYMLARQTVESAEVTAGGPGRVFIPAQQVKQLSTVKMDAPAPMRSRGKPCKADRLRVSMGRLTNGTDESQDDK